jgi:predicted RNase H-like HicB family nuclease
MATNETTNMIRSFRYEIVLYWSGEDRAFIAEVPELAGCAADGSTYQEALASVAVVVDEWLATARDLGRQIPQPRSPKAFSRGPDFN